MKQIQHFQKHWLQLTSSVVCRLKTQKISIYVKKKMTSNTLKYFQFLAFLNINMA